MSTYTYMLQVRTLDGSWANLQDPHTGGYIGFGAVRVPETKLANVAHKIMRKLGYDTPSSKQRIVFFAGDRGNERLIGDDVYGVVTNDLDAVTAYSAGRT
ncbi:MAG: hypothetical protein J2P20_18825 [Pseudonocardia sp.]|nr:hypothetical protein [Pseudonocardia sp.]MBO0875888.1 hypothetical protein [Pseudonocardia sp.]